jgi:hypothetical protein
MNLLNQLWRRGTKSRSELCRANKPAAFHPRLEVLEDRFLPSTNPTTAWVQATSAGAAVATDSTGNVYIAGGNSVAKYSSAGGYQWAASMGGAGDALAVDNLGHVDVVGSFSGTASFGSTTLIGTSSDPSHPLNPFVVQLDANTGNVLWALNPFSTASGHFASAVAVDSTGNVYVTGTNSSTNSFFATKVDPYGNLVWQDQITPNMGTWGNDNSIGGVAVSGTNVFFSGSFGLSATFATYPTGAQICTVTNAGAQTGVAAYVVELTSANQFVGGDGLPAACHRIQVSIGPKWQSRRRQQRQCLRLWSTLGRGELRQLDLEHGAVRPQRQRQRWLWLGLYREVESCAERPLGRESRHGR